MSAFLVTLKDSKLIDTPVFAADETDEIVMVFTTQQSAQQYIDDSDWGESYVVATLDPITLVEWLLMCHRSGVDSIATDPKRSDQQQGIKINSLSIEAHLKHAGEHIISVANPDF